MTRRQDAERNFIVIVHFWAEHDFEIGDKAILDEPIVEFAGVGRDKRKVMSDGEVVVAGSRILRDDIRFPKLADGIFAPIDIV